MSNASSDVTVDQKKPILINRRPAPAGLGRPYWVLAVTLFSFLLSQVVVAPILLVLGHHLISPHTSLDLQNSIVDQFFYVLIAEATIAAIPIYIVKKRKLKPSTIGLGRRPVVGDVGRAAIGFAVFFGLLVLSGILVNIFSPNITNQHQDVGFNNISTNGQENLALLSLVIFAPIGEEILMRGYLYSGLRRYWNFTPALIVTSLVFGAAHLFEATSGLLWIAAIDTFLLSVVLVYLRERTGALYAGILVHMANNLIAFGIHFK